MMELRVNIGVILHDHKRGLIDTDLAADAILALPEIRDALQTTAEISEALRGGGSYSVTRPNA